MQGWILPCVIHLCENKNLHFVLFVLYSSENLLDQLCTHNFLKVCFYKDKRTFKLLIFWWQQIYSKHGKYPTPAVHWGITEVHPVLETWFPTLTSRLALFILLPWQYLLLHPYKTQSLGSALKSFGLGFPQGCCSSSTGYM